VRTVTRVDKKNFRFRQSVKVWVQRNKSVGFVCQSKLPENIFYNDVVIEVQRYHISRDQGNK